MNRQTSSMSRPQRSVTPEPFDWQLVALWMVPIVGMDIYRALPWWAAFPAIYAIAYGWMVLFAIRSGEAAERGG